MKRRFTILSAALALLVSLAIPMGMRGQTTYEQLTSIANIDESAQYVLGIDGTGFHYEGTSSWGKTALPSAQTPVYYTLTKATDGNSFTAHATISGTTYYLQIPTSNTFSMATSTGTNTDIIIGTTQVSGTNYAVANKTTTARHLRINGTSGLRSYAGTTGTMAFFYKVVTSSSNTYTVTFDAGDGTFVGNTDFPNTSNTKPAGTYTLPSAERSGYTFDGWVTGNNDPITGSYTVSGNVDFTAAYTENDTPTPGGNLNLTFNLTSNPGDWPTSASTSLTNFDYTLAGVDYTFALNNVYCNSGYLMLKSVAVLGLPAIEGYKLTTVVAHNSNGCSTSTKVGISSSATQASYIAGGAAQTWSTQGSTYTYNLTSTEENTMYYMYVTNKNAQLFSLDLIYEAVAASTIATPTFDPTSGTEFGDDGLNVSITCETNNVSIYYTLNGDTPNNQSTLYNGAISLTETTTINAIAYDGTNYSNVATATYTYVDPNAPGTENNPYTVAQAIANTPSSGNVYIQGIVSSFHNTSIVGDGSNYRYYISDDGTTTTQLLVYKGKGLNQATFTNADDLLVGDEVVIYGTLITYQSAPEVASGNYLYSWNRPSTPTQEYTLTVTASENVEIYTFVGESTEQGIEGNTTQQVYNGTEIGLSVSASEGYVLTLMVDGEDVTSQLDETGYYTFNMPTHAVTVTATASLAPVVTTNTYTLATSIESGKQYIIVGWANGTPYAMGYDKGNNRHAVEISVTGDNNENASATIANTETNPHEFTITSLATAGYYSIQDATTSGYLYAAGSSSNHLKTEAELDANHNGDWKITISEGLFSIAADQSSNRNVMQFNNSNNLFACYASASQHPVYLYVKDETPVTETIELPITGYGTGTGNWYLIATPIGDVAPTNVANMLSNTYDLYYFDQDTDGNGNEWINYKGDATHPGMGGFDLEIGKGYLYANSEDVRLLFTGRCPVTQSTYSVTLKKTDGARFAGWNLVGNPYADIAYFADNRDFYTMNSTATAFELIGAEDARHIQAMEGVFVTADVDDEEVVFTTTAPAKTGNRLALNLSQGNNVIDRAFIRFGECRQLPKLQFNQNSTKVYIPMDDKDYAVVRAEEMGEMPVNFKAESNGTYSLNFGMDNVEFAYLHLIDNLTGNEVDLLQTPSYSFEAKTTDYENRFKLVFATGDNSNEDNFAYFSSGSFVINNEGNATLQVIDITGRIVKSESVNGCANVNVNGAAGVYMLRLVNGDNVKTQKVVVK